jgi:hypothetical protein
VCLLRVHALVVGHAAEIDQKRDGLQLYTGMSETNKPCQVHYRACEKDVTLAALKQMEAVRKKRKQVDWYSSCALTIVTSVSALDPRNIIHVLAPHKVLP